MNREIIFTGIRNVRDLGGLKTADGRKIREKLLIRSAHLHDADAEDVRRLKDDYNLNMIIDLRTGQEVTEKPDVVIEDTDYEHLPVFVTAVSGISHEENSKRVRELKGMAGLYRAIVSREECQEAFGGILRMILNHDFNEGSILWHCTEGKDRCGLVSAFILKMLKVADDEIKQDYLLTNITNEPKADMYYDEMIRRGKSEVEASWIRDMFLAKEEYYDTAFKTIEDSYGTFDDYLLKALKIDEALIADFRERILE